MSERPVSTEREPRGSNIERARALAEEAISRDDCKLTEALLADAVGHLCDELAAIGERIDRLEVIR